MSARRRRNGPAADLPYHGITPMSSTAWWRLLIPISIALLFVVLILVQTPEAWTLAVLLCIGLAVYVVIAWSRVRTTFTVDETGVTFRYGLGLGTRHWSAGDFRSVHLRQVPPGSLNIQVGGTGKRRNRRVQAARREDITEVPGVPLFTTGRVYEPSELQVSQAGQLVEIIGKGEWNYLFSPEDPEAAAQAVGAVLPGRR